MKCIPVRHCELNPKELIWAQVKGFVAKNNTTFRLKDAKELTYAAFGKNTNDVWTKAEMSKPNTTIGKSHSCGDKTLQML